EDPAPPTADAPFAERMIYRVATKAGRQRYKLRQQTVEPVFGIIKEALGFRRFSLRGLSKVSLEWTRVKTTLEIPDTLFRQAKATAAIHGQTLKKFVNEALQEKLSGASSKQGTCLDEVLWRRQTVRFFH
ncbi:MAG: transposase, partial [Chthoniobacteraceae bacterium]|nr:transposase [Chthoniobacteraceae bacterium]